MNETSRNWLWHELSRLPLMQEILTAQYGPPQMRSKACRRRLPSLSSMSCQRSPRHDGPCAVYYDGKVVATFDMRTWDAKTPISWGLTKGKERPKLGDF